MKCPVCEAEVVADAPKCRRCRADLAQLFAIEQSSRVHVQQAKSALRLGLLEEAEFQASTADEQCKNVEAREILAVCRLLQRDYAGAFQMYMKLTDEPA